MTNLDRSVGSSYLLHRDPRIEALLEVQPYLIPTDGPEADRTLKWR